MRAVPGTPLVVTTPIDRLPLLVGMGAAQSPTGPTAPAGAGAPSMFSPNDGAKEAACHGAANSATNNLLSARPVISHILGIGPAIALAPGIGIGCQSTGRHDGDKRGGENSASVHN